MLHKCVYSFKNTEIVRKNAKAKEWYERLILYIRNNHWRDFDNFIDDFDNFKENKILCYDSNEIQHYYLKPNCFLLL